MPRKMKIELDGVKVVADLLEDKAPRTRDAFWSILPIDRRDALHYVRGCIFFVHDKLPYVERENHPPFVSQGDVVLTPDREFILVHGRRCLLRTYPTGLHPSNCFAIIPIWQENFKKFEDVAENLKRTGAKK